MPTAGGVQTRTHARELRRLLEALDDVSRACGEVVERAQHLADADDISARVAKTASRIERWAEVRPAMFEDLFDEELAKYDRFPPRLHEKEERQRELLASIEVTVQFDRAGCFRA
jgi:programmed cell death 6-interacting protein